MSIKSVRWIKRKCTPPTHAMVIEGRVHQLFTAINADHVEVMAARADARDGYIRPIDDADLFDWQPMIEPFEPNQIKFKNDPDIDLKTPVISYGNSSFGYDVRAADEWEIFTNINSAVVDPKAVDSNCLKTVKADSILIPPNSFALARTVEYFRIPRDVLVVCLGKSTYARCFTGDTKVALVDGRSLSFKEMAKRAKDGERFFGYTIRPNGSMGVEELVAPRKTGKKEKLVAVRLDNGEKIRCTPDHKFMLRDGSYMEAQDLYPGVSLMPLMRYEARGYEMTYCPKRGCLAGTHRMADAWNLRNGVYAKRKNQHRHHRDHDRRNNNPYNIKRMSASKHIRMHNAEKFSDPGYMEFHTSQIKKGLSKYIANNPEKWLAAQRQKRVDFWQEEQYAESRERMLKKRNKTLSSAEHRQGCRDRMLARIKSAALKGEVAFERRSGEDHHNHRGDLTDKRVMRAFKEIGTVVGAADFLNVSKQTLYRRFEDLITKAQQKGYLACNHKVLSVTRLKKRRDVYCVTVPNTHNFALEAGVFVHNCGIIVNVTPLEPEWEGHVTLEFSNTTNLPARIYANEGVAQMLFFQSDEECEVSYKDRGGKYQGQTGVTRPKA